jgi:hypothetical protein
MTRRRILLLGVAGLLTATALLAIAILLVGSFGGVQRRVLGSTALLAGFGLLGLPGVVLLDQGRGRRLALAAEAVTALAAGVALALIWGPESQPLGKTLGTLVALVLVGAQTATLVARRQERDSRAVRRLFAAACATAAVAAAGATALLWSEPQGALWPRLFGALVVLDLLLVALQPVLARARPAEAEHRFAVVLAGGERTEVAIAGGDVASAAAKAIRAAERRGGRVVRLEVEDREARTAV